MARDGDVQPPPDVAVDAELQTAEARTEDIAAHETDAKPWYRSPHMIKLNLLMVNTPPGPTPYPR